MLIELTSPSPLSWSPCRGPTIIRLIWTQLLQDCTVVKYKLYVHAKKQHLLYMLYWNINVHFWKFKYKYSTIKIEVKKINCSLAVLHQVKAVHRTYHHFCTDLSNFGICNYVLYICCYLAQNTFCAVCYSSVLAFALT